MDNLAVILSAFAFAFSFLSLLISILAYPKVLSILIDKRAQELSTRTVVPGALFDMMEKNPDFMPSAADIEFPKEAERAEIRKNKAGYG